ncbi:MAG: hypothetical protein EBY22_15470 [Gammaproteobacteria bacterium]|jgi:uncharacterized protein|nr:hypothetical protein [Gammaproteobacteria bacterium]
MEIQKQILSSNAIESYQANQVTIAAQVYQKGVLVTASLLISPWGPSRCEQLQIKDWANVSLEGIDVLVIGHQDNFAMIPNEVRAYFAEHKIGVEVMSLGAACRTFNILLSEARGAMLCLILSS